MRTVAAAAFLAAALTAACAPKPQGPPFPPGAQPHGPYLDRSFEGSVVRAVYVDDVTVILVQPAANAPEVKSDLVVEARSALRDGAAIGPIPTDTIAADAAQSEAVALKAAEVPGWCPFETRFSFLDPVQTPVSYAFKIRGSYSGTIGAFVFAGQCRSI